MRRSSVNLALAMGLLAAATPMSDDVVASEPRRKSERERAEAAERGRQSRERSRAASAKTPSDITRLQAAAERRARKVSRQAKGFSAPATQDGGA